MLTQGFWKKSGHISFFAAILFSGITLLAVGVPRFIHELVLVPEMPIFYGLLSGEDAPEEQISLLESSRLRALSFAASPKAYYQLGTTYLVHASRASDNAERIRYAMLSIEALRRGLAISGDQTYGWLRLATAYTLLGSNSYSDALGAWRNSIEAARFEPLIIFQRLHIGIVLYSNMNQQDKQLLRDQLKLAYNWDRGPLRQYARKNDLTEWFVFLAEENQVIVEYLRG